MKVGVMSIETEAIAWVAIWRADPANGEEGTKCNKYQSETYALQNATISSSET